MSIEVIIASVGVILTIIGNAYFLGAKISGIRGELDDLKPRILRVEKFFDDLIKKQLDKVFGE